MKIRTDGVYEAHFGGERRRFRLPFFGELRTLQDLHDIGPAEFERLFRTNKYKTQHLFDVFKWALIGGDDELTEEDADKICRATLLEGRIQKYVMTAHMIILVTLGPLDDDEDDAKKNGDDLLSEVMSELSDPLDKSPTETSLGD